MADPNDHHDDPVVVDPIQDPVVPDSQTPSPARLAQQLRAGGSRIAGEGLDCSNDASSCGLGQGAKLTRRGPTDDDAMGHFPLAGSEPEVGLDPLPGDILLVERIGECCFDRR